MTLPVSGPLPRPQSLEQARDALRAESFEAPPGIGVVTFTTDEFTAVCPRTGQPDFCTVTIEYQPAAGCGCLESKSLKYYLWAWRDEGAFCETLATRIAADVDRAIAPEFVTVTITQKPRGGLALTAQATRLRRSITGPDSRDYTLGGV